MSRTKKGFTLIELMIVIAIIAIIAAIAIPNLVQSRIRANEASAVTAVKAYATAQVTFAAGRHGREATNLTPNTVATDYCPNFRNLFYGVQANDTNKNLELISMAHADAFIDEPSPVGGATNPSLATPAGNPTPYTGYQFIEPAELTGLDFGTKFGQLAVPANSSSTGNNAYWIGLQGTVYMTGLTADDDADTNKGINTPSSGVFTGTLDWLSM